MPHVYGYVRLCDLCVRSASGAMAGAALPTLPSTNAGTLSMSHHSQVLTSFQHATKSRFNPAPHHSHAKLQKYAQSSQSHCSDPG